MCTASTLTDSDVIFLAVTYQKRIYLEWLFHNDYAIC